MSKLKNQRHWLCSDVDSYISLSVPEKYTKGYTLKLADCNRKAELYFDTETAKDRKASARKLLKVKQLIDKLYEELQENRDD